MKIAIVHEMLIKLGGAERVLEEFIKMYPDADVYTLMYDEGKVGKVFPKEKIHCIGLAQWLYMLTKKPRASLPLMPFSIAAIDVSDYDMVISSSSGFAHGVGGKNKKEKRINNKEEGLFYDISEHRQLQTPNSKLQPLAKKPFHICYCHSPARYLWDWTDEVQAEIFGKYKVQSTKYKVIHFLKLLGLPLVKFLLWWLRKVDLRASQSPDLYIANSREVQGRIQKYYGRTSEVVWPPIHTGKYKIHPPRRTKYKKSKCIYYVMTSALTPFKRVDIPVRVLSALGIPLKIIGAGDQRADLECLAGPTIQFLGRLSDSEVFEVYAGARGFLMPQKEDAGMAPLEAMAAGLPVFGQAAGGLLETNSDGVTGRFFATEDDASFREAFIAFDAEVSGGRYDDSSVFERHVAQYDVSVFRERFQSYVPGAMTSDSETE